MPERIKQHQVERILAVIEGEVNNMAITDAHNIMAGLSVHRQLRIGIVPRLVDPANGTLVQEIVQIDESGQIPEFFTDTDSLTEIIQSSGIARPSYYLYLGIPKGDDDVFCIFSHMQNGVWVGETTSLSENDFDYNPLKTTALVVPSAFEQKFGSDKDEDPLKAIRTQLKQTLRSYLP